MRRAIVERLLALIEADALPVVPSQGSVGASGDLAPLAHMSAALIGEGEIALGGETLPAAEALARLGLEPLVLGPKEGLALINGTQVSTAIALDVLFTAERVFATALVSGALATDALKGTDVAFDPRIHDARGQPGQIAVAAALRGLLAESAIRHSHDDCDRVQDPYSFRCQPQVMGAALDLIRNAARTLEIEANAVSDNPLVVRRGRALRRQFPRPAGGVRGRHLGPRPVRDRLDRRAAARRADRSQDERPAALPDRGQRRQFRLHDRAGDGRRLGLRE